MVSLGKPDGMSPKEYNKILEDRQRAADAHATFVKHDVLQCSCLKCQRIRFIAEGGYEADRPRRLEHGAEDVPLDPFRCDVV